MRTYKKYHYIKKLCMILKGYQIPTDLTGLHRRSSFRSHTCHVHIYIFLYLDGESKDYLVHVNHAKLAILEQEDTNRDFQVTVEDTGPKAIRLGTLKSGGLVKGTIHGTYMISALLQELALSEDQVGSHMVINEARLRENPVDRLLKMIETRFWPALIRRLDAKGLQMACMDAKNRGGEQRARIYVPQDDQLAIEYYKQVAKSRPELDLDVIVLPKEITPEYVLSIRNKPGVLSLSLTLIENFEGLNAIQGTPFVVPGGRFNELYGWDSYFCVLGLLEQPDPNGYYLYLAKSVIDNLVYEINHYGKILNANRSYYLTRSQPPFLTSMAAAVYEMILKSKHSHGGYFEIVLSGPEKWYKNVMLAAIKEYQNIWMTSPRCVPAYDLSRYYDEGIGIPTETEASHYYVVLREFAEKWKMSCDDFIEAYNSGKIKEPDLDAYFCHDRALRESGHDTTYRLEGKTVDLLTVDLNSLLYKYERDIADYIYDHCDDRLEVGEGKIMTSEDWTLKAEARKMKMYLLMWDSEKGLWFDYDFVNGTRAEYESVTSFWTMWAGLANLSDAKTMMSKSLPMFEVAGGLVAGTESSRGPVSLLRPNRQWDYPYGWVPHQMLAWDGFIRYGYSEDAKRIAYRWLYMITKCFADYNAVVPEKFDVVHRTHKVTAEYGNVGTDFKLVPKEGFGWMNASFQVGLSLLNRSERRALELLIPPEKLFGLH